MLLLLHTLFSFLLMHFGAPAGLFFYFGLSVSPLVVRTHINGQTSKPSYITSKQTKTSKQRHNKRMAERKEQVEGQRKGAHKTTYKVQVNKDRGENEHVITSSGGKDNK